MSKCRVCEHGRLQERNVEKWLRSGERWVLFRNVPALVCDECGETAFPQGTVERLAAVLSPDSGTRPTELVYSLVYDLERIGQAQATGQMPLREVGSEATPVGTTIDWPAIPSFQVGTVAIVLTKEPAA